MPRPSWEKPHLSKTSSDDEWRQMMRVNLDGVFFCCRETVRWMKAQKSGRIILFSSVASLTPTPGAIHYSAAKAGVNMLGKTLAKEVARHNIQVNIIAPGYIETPMLDKMPEGFLDHILKKTPQGRLGTTRRNSGPGVISWPPIRQDFLPAGVQPQRGVGYVTRMKI